MQQYMIFVPGQGGTYMPPDLTMRSALVPGLAGYQFNASNRGLERNPLEMMDAVARPPIAIPQAYMTRGLMTEQKLGAGRGVLPTIIVTGRV